MCTVVVGTSEAGSVQILALRDELTSRDFDDPAEWWPDHPGIVGGRDRTAGGTWCASSIGTGVTALVLNRPQRRVAAPGAPSRGLLPLLAATYGAEWPAHLRQLAGMASFSLVLVGPGELRSWTFDGEGLASEEHHPARLRMFTSGGEEDGKAARYLADFHDAPFPAGWREILAANPPAADPASLVVRIERDQRVYATVFAQLIEASPGRLRVDYTRAPSDRDSWQTLVRP